MLNNYKKYGGNDIAANVAQREHSNIKCYTSAFSNREREREMLKDKIHAMLDFQICIYILTVEGFI